MSKSEVLKEVAAVMRSESANIGGPVQASLMRMADRLDAKAAEGEAIVVKEIPPEDRQEILDLLSHAPTGPAVVLPIDSEDSKETE